MKSINRPTETISDILEIFKSDNVRQNIIDQINTVKSGLTNLENLYIDKVQNNTLYEIDRGIPATIPVTKEVLIRYYEYRLLEKTKARDFYDKLLISAPYNICPYCTIKYVKTLDHFLPKSEYPIYSVTPSNLIPCCRDCNTEKKISYPTNEDDQTFHPYFDIVDNEPWIFAELLKTEPLSFQYKVYRLPHWNDNKHNRSINHFDGYSINELFSNEANRELRAMQHQFKELLRRDRELLKKHLEETFDSCQIGAGLLDWKTLMYKELSTNEWFLDGCIGYDFFS